MFNKFFRINSHGDQIIDVKLRYIYNRKKKID